LVKVITSSLLGSTPESSRCAALAVTTRVLPLPGPKPQEAVGNLQGLVRK
jgi:hypothetical protein